MAWTRRKATTTTRNGKPETGVSMGNQHWNREQMNVRQSLLRDLIAKFPDEAARTLARRLSNTHPMHFPTLENARTAIRREFGQCGNRERNIARNPRPARKPGQMPPLPKSMAREWLPFDLDARRSLVISDIHLPFQDDEALELALAYGDKYQPDCVLVNGDLFDFYQLSRFDKDPTQAKVTDELEAGRMFFAHVRHRFPKARIVFKLGNHDERWGHYLRTHAPHLCGIESVRDSWEKAAGIPDNGVEVVGEQRPITVGPLWVLHGHEKGRGVFNPVNQARGTFLRLLASALEGHGHRTSTHTERTADGRIIACWSTGCLCDLTPEYARINKWDHGFATVDLWGDGYEVDLKRIINGKVR